MLLDLSKADDEFSLSRGSQFEGPLFALINSSEIRFLHAYGNRIRGHYGCNSSCNNLQTLLLHNNQVSFLTSISPSYGCDNAMACSVVRNTKRHP